MGPFTLALAFLATLLLFSGEVMGRMLREEMQTDDSA